MSAADFLVVGGGIAGLSAAARLARHGRTIVVEAEEALGYHSSGRSVSFSHYGIGNAPVRAMTAWSRSFFEAQPEGFCETPIARIMPSLYFATAERLDALDALARDMAAYTDAIEPVGPEAMARLCPALKTGEGGALRGLLDPTGLKLDADALLHSYARAVRGGGSEIRLGLRIAAIERTGGVWRVSTERGETLEAPVLVNAAGAWGDRIAAMAGVEPLGIEPKRRTIIVVEPPAGVDPSPWPFVHAVEGGFYMLPEAGRLLVSPVDEVADSPCDAQPEDYDVALAAWGLEQHTNLTVPRIAHRWAGLRSFVADRVPTAGFASDAPGFLWLVGQGGYGLQTAPAMAAAVEAIATGGAWPEGLAELGVTAATIDPLRFVNGSTHSAET